MDKIPDFKIEFLKSVINYMGFGDFYKGDKKKKKKGEGNKGISASPVFTAPTVAPKGKTKY